VLVLGYFTVFISVVLAEFIIAIFHRVGSCNQAIAKETIAGFNAFCIFRLKGAGLAFAPRETFILGDSGLVAETFNVTDLRKSAGGIHSVDAGNRT